jgi:adenylyltransferase/sulfurtransferase
MTNINLAGTELSQEEIIHYSRHLIMPEIGVSGQKKLKASAVLMIGAGGLGAPLAQYLAAAGVGTIGIVEFDTVDKSNLHRQVLYSQEQVGQPKLDCAQQRLNSLNPHIKIVPHDLRLTADNALDLFKDYDLIVDGTDNFPTRYLVNDACVILGKPNVYASIYRFEGQLSVFWADKGPCYRCLYPEPPPPGLVPSCAEGGVLGILPGIMGTLQANEAVKVLLGIGEPMVGRLLTFDALAMQFKQFGLRKDPTCPLCSENATQTSLIDYHEFCGIPGEDDYGDEFEHIEQITATELDAAIKNGEAVTIVDIRSSMEYEISHLENTVHIPLEQLGDKFSQIDPSSKIVCLCYRGVRSLDGAQQLKDLGFEDVTSLKGGILSWSSDVDTNVLRY